MPYFNIEVSRDQSVGINKMLLTCDTFVRYEDEGESTLSAQIHTVLDNNND